ncbi:MAG TPA: isochorismatase family cysteine hydrolase [Actinomycetota bacterium]|nr:isochorismatase family cysteine hydrolase [Actinomycetota bacterium]
MTVALGDMDPRRAALLVIDMQNAFCHPEGTLGISGVDTSDCAAAIAPISELIAAATDADVPVIWTFQEHLPDDRWRARRELPAHTAKRARVAALAGTWDAELVEELAPLAKDPSLVIRKHRFGAFYQTRLELLLRMLGRTALIVTGVTANACIETTMREAYLRDYDVVAVFDAIGGIDERWKTLASEVWAQYMGIVVTSKDAIAWLSAERR